MRTLKTLFVGMALLATTAAFSQPIVLGHRGGRHEQDENTLSAFQNAYKAGIHAFETDIRLSQDGVLIVSHDGSLDRMTTSTGNVEKMTSAQLRKVVTKNGHPLLFLEDLLDFFKDKPGLYVEFEMKTSDVKEYPDAVIPEYCEKAYKALKAKMPKDANWSMTSFDYRAIKYIAEHHPEVNTMLISSRPCSNEMIELCKAVGTKRMAVTLNGSSREAVERAHKAGINVNLWPGGTVEDSLLAYLLGADYICTDYPIKVKEYFAEKLPWVPIRFGEK